MPSFLAQIKHRRGMAALALEFLILTASDKRIGKPGITWAQLDINNAVWTIPANRMKSGKSHKVPLCKLFMFKLLYLTIS